MKTRKLLLTALSTMLVATSAFAFASCDQLKGAAGEKGPQGDKGIQGEAGANGVGVEKVEYDADGNIKITYTDGRTDTVGMPSENHNYGAWNVYFAGDAYCGDGLYYRVCKDCNDLEWKQDKVHNYIVSGTPATCVSEGLEIKTCATCNDVVESVLPMGHNADANGVCGTCAKQVIGTEGIVYENKGEYAIVSTYTGNTANVVIAEEFEGLPVTQIGNFAFSAIASDPGSHIDLAGIVTSIKMPNTITEIGTNAFAGLTSVETITLSSNLQKIGNWAFNTCSKLTGLDLPVGLKSIGDNAFRKAFKEGATLELPEGLESIGATAFYDADGLVGTIRFPESCLDIGDSVLQNASKITKVVFPQGITTFKRFCFGMDDLEEVNIPDLIESLPGASFYKANLKNVYIGKNVGSFEMDDKDRTPFESVSFPADAKIYYNGTANDWNSGLIFEGKKDGDIYDTMAQYLCFYSKNEPTKEGSFWHYDEAGAIVEWPAYQAPSTDADTPNTGDNSGSSEQAPGTSENAPGTSENAPNANGTLG